MPGPADLIEYFTVKYWTMGSIADGADPGDEPDRVNLNGWITFSPNLSKAAPVVKYPTATDPSDPLVSLGFELFPQTRRIKVENGRLADAGGNGYVKLEANSVHANPPVWTWHVSFDLTGPNGKVPREAFDIAAVPGSVVDLTVVSPASSDTGVQTIQGPPGPGIASVYIQGDDELVFVRDDLTGTELPPVVVPMLSSAASARDDAILARDAAQGYRDAASGHATAASGSAGAASASAGNAATAAAAALAYRDQAQAIANGISINIGTVTTVPTGQPATAGITGTAPNWTLNLGLPEGEMGPAGTSPNATASTAGIIMLTGDFAGAYNAPEIGSKKVTAAKIADDTITAAQIAANAIGSSELADNAVDEAAIAALAVTTGKLADGAVTSAKIADGTIMNADINAAAAIAGSKIADNSITALQIAADAVGSSELANDAVDSAAIAALAVMTGKLADGAVTSLKIADDTIVDADINSAAAISLSKLAAGNARSSVNGTPTSLTFWVGTEAQYNTATSNGTSLAANTVYLRSA